MPQCVNLLETTHPSALSAHVSQPSTLPCRRTCRITCPEPATEEFHLHQLVERGRARSRRQSSVRNLRNLHHHNLLVDPLHSFMWDQSDHLDCLFRRVTYWHMLDGPLLHLFMRTTLTASIVFQSNLKHWHIDSPLLHSIMWDEPDHLSLPTPEAVARQSVVAIVHVGPIPPHRRHWHDSPLLHSFHLDGHLLALLCDAWTSLPSQPFPYCFNPSQRGLKINKKRHQEKSILLCRTLFPN